MFVFDIFKKKSVDSQFNDLNHKAKTLNEREIQLQKRGQEIFVIKNTGSSSDNSIDFRIPSIKKESKIQFIKRKFCCIK